jgi:hypothetical protein
MVLMDNTTVHGAVHAYTDWPPAPTAWMSHPYAVNLRSLMDMIEAIILFEQIRLDNACYSLVAPEGDQDHYYPHLPESDPLAGELSWQPFQNLKDTTTGDHIFGVEDFTVTPEVIGSGIVATSAEKLQSQLKSGSIQQQAGLFKTYGIERAIPEFYSSPQQFSDLLRQSFARQAVASVENELAELEQALLNQPPEVANYAMFAFRGFYYDELATLLNISYVPHAFRSNLLMHDTPAKRSTFVRLTLSTIDGLRQDYVEELGRQISEQLNSELAGPTFKTGFPLIAAYVAGHASRRSELMPIALEVRNSPAARSFRQWVTRVQSAIDQQARLQVVREARQQLDDLSSDLRRELRLPGGNQTQINVKLAAPGGIFGVDVPMQVRARLPAWVMRVIHHRRTHLKFLRDLALSGIEYAPFELRYRTLNA